MTYLKRVSIFCTQGILTSKNEFICKADNMEDWTIIITDVFCTSGEEDDEDDDDKSTREMLRKSRGRKILVLNEQTAVMCPSGDTYPYPK